MPSFWHAGEGLVKLMELRMPGHFIASEAAGYLLVQFPFSRAGLNVEQAGNYSATPLCSSIIDSLWKSSGNRVEVGDTIHMARQGKPLPALLCLGLV